MKPGEKGLARWWSALRYSRQGFAAAYRHEAAFREETWLALVAVPLGVWLGDNALEIVLLVGSILLLMLVEMLNSAIEAVVDRQGDEWHELSGRAKDMGSAAVLLAIVMLLWTWGWILWSHISA
jgi:diacylglycerol kinase (ATP)